MAAVSNNDLVVYDGIMVIQAYRDLVIHQECQCGIFATV